MDVPGEPQLAGIVETILPEFNASKMIDPHLRVNLFVVSGDAIPETDHPGSFLQFKGHNVDRRWPGLQQ